MSSKTAR